MNTWVAFGTDKNYKHHHINAIYEDLGREKSLALPVLHSFTGCDTTSDFFGIGKKSAREAQNCFQDVTSAFTFMVFHPCTEMDVDVRHFQLLECFTFILYNKISDLQHIHKARKEPFCQKGKTIERLSPNPGCTTAALKMSCLSGWNMVNQWTEWTTWTYSWRLGMDPWRRQPVMGSCVEHVTYGFNSLQWTCQMQLQRSKRLWC